MPHIVMEYSDPVSERVNIGQLLEDLHQTAIGSGEFGAADVKSRAYASHEWLVGENDNQENFIHVTLWLLDGRDEKQKHNLSHAFLDVLKQHGTEVASLTVDVRDMDRRWYAKATKE
ncbi:5-carboxymethyl-2-hydroxymuconate Delta-isomerase [Enterovibrio makurazakiensis]|uniref:5-carboxymethyl-2-hydroxymuconate Delta-isomerase n=1 Tax=Enterovibrio gelatinilyticus TaxID=2899819 RepID=A0ABT5R023_9GAMM|nr:5-carboxymethyl-2-hydroxymuconate Delta-isomerase [Enterovibrio sp. ZSDZ42]MDD1793625.1 5-carboxymethyl-2-hydroxymuconate Delta-isomerase [Enterovibrio sp. ZSDZ42]